MNVDGPNIKPEVATALKALVAQGALNGGALKTDDCRRDYEDLKAKGVEFPSPPADRFYGVELRPQGQLSQLVQHDTAEMMTVQ